MPIGMAYPMSIERGEAPAAEIHRLATKGRNLGMKGVICPMRAGCTRERRIYADRGAGCIQQTGA